MKIFHFSIHALVFVGALLLGTSAVVASRFVITTVASLTKTTAVSESVFVPAEPENVPVFEDLRSETLEKADDFDPTGSYSLVMDDVPAVFAEIVFLEIATREYKEQDGAYVNRPIIPNGLIQTTKTFAFAKIAVANREISFETDTQDGASYQFVGYFPLSSEYIACVGCEQAADLHGKLRKLKNGKVVAELDVKFYSYGC